MEVVRTPGSVLRAAREAHGISVRELAAITRIAPRLLESLEEDRYEEFPAEVFVRGFLRNCARELRLDADELVDLYRRRTGRQATRSASEAGIASDPEMADLFQTSQAPRYGYLAAILAIILGLGLSLIIFGDNSSEELSDSQITVPASSQDWDTLTP